MSIIVEENNPFTLSNRKTKLTSKKKISTKACLLTGFLLILGLICLTLSIDFFLEHADHKGFLPLLVISMLVLLPGVYSFYQILKTIKGWNRENNEHIITYEQL